MKQGCDLQRRKKRGNHISCRSAQISRITILTLKSKKKSSFPQKNHIQMGISLMKMKSRILFKMQNIKVNFLMIYHQEALRHWLVLSHCCLHQKSALYSAHQKLELILHHHHHPQKSLESLLLFVPLQAIKNISIINFLRHTEL